jgi:hypothetical protein
MRGEFLGTISESALPPAALLDGMTARLAQLDEIDPAKDVHWLWQVEDDDRRP